MSTFDNRPTFHIYTTEATYLSQPSYTRFDAPLFPSFFERCFSPQPTYGANPVPPQPPPCALADCTSPLPPKMLVAAASRLPWLVGRLGAVRPRRSRRRKLRTWER